MRNRRNITCTFIAVGAGLLVASPGLAAIINVPGNQPTIQAGINVAVNGDTVVVAVGIYPGAIDLMGKAITVRSTDPNSKSVVASTVIDGGGADHTVRIDSGEGPSTVLSGFVITGGIANGGGSESEGGGLQISGSSPTILNCTIANNQASNGGGVMLRASAALFRHCAFIANTATNNGGALDTGNGTTARFVNCWFLSNTGNNGGAASARDGLTFVNCTFTGNIGNSGAGAFCSNTASEFLCCTFNCNTSNNAGGGIHVFNAPNVLINDCTFVDNTATNAGGGVHTQAIATVISGSTFHGNSAAAGGGIGGTGYTLSGTGLCQNVPDNAPGPFTNGGGNSLQICAPPVESCEDACDADVNRDGAVGIIDFLEVLVHWGTCP